MPAPAATAALASPPTYARGAADEALAVVEHMGVPADDVVFVRVDEIGVHLALLPTNEDRAKAIVNWAGAALTHQRVGRITVNAGND